MCRLYGKYASYLRLVLIFLRISGPIVLIQLHEIHRRSHKIENIILSNYYKETLVSTLHGKKGAEKVRTFYSLLFG